MVVRSKGLRLQNEDSTMAKLVSTQKRRKKSSELNSRESSTVFKLERFNCVLHSSLTFVYMPVFGVKKTVLMDFFRLTRSDRTV